MNPFLSQVTGDKNDILSPAHWQYDNLREFVYSRHPDPRRVWKRGSEQHLLTPLPGAPGAPGDPRDPRAPRASSKKLDVAVKTNTNVTFGRPIPN